SSTGAVVAHGAPLNTIAGRRSFVSSLMSMTAYCSANRSQHHAARTWPRPGSLRRRPAVGRSADMPGTAPVSVVVLTRNEGRNLRACLESGAGWAAEVFVVDSGSTDATLMIARQFDATIRSHAFETHARQWSWALAELPLTTDWVLAVDADQRLTPELRASLSAELAAPRANGYFMCRRQIFRGRWIRHGGYYPKYLLKLFRRTSVSIDHTDLVDHHFHVTGPVAKLRGDLIEDNRNEAQIAEWTAKHNRYAVLQARQEFAAAGGPTIGVRAVLGSPDDRMRWLKHLWAG